MCFVINWGRKVELIPFYDCYTYTTFTESMLSESLSLIIDNVVLKIENSFYLRAMVTIFVKFYYSILIVYSALVMHSNVVCLLEMLY